jgi:hypothetical protein
MAGMLAYAGSLYVMGLSLRDLQMALSWLLNQVLSTPAINRITLQVQAQMERYLTYQALPTHTSDGQPLDKAQARKPRWQHLKPAAYAIYDAPSRLDAQASLAQFVAKWGLLEPAALHAFQWGIQHTFVFYEFEKALHPMIRTTNLLERFFREFRTKTDEIGAFPNETSCLPLFLIVATFDHAKHDRLPVANTS